MCSWSAWVEPGIHIPIQRTSRLVFRILITAVKQHSTFINFKGLGSGLPLTASFLWGDMPQIPHQQFTRERKEFGDFLVPSIHSLF